MLQNIVMHYKSLFYTSFTMNGSGSSNRIPSIGIFTSGEEKYGEGSQGLKELLDRASVGDLKTRIEVIISNKWNGGAREKAYNSGIRFQRIGFFPEKRCNELYNQESVDSIKKIYKNIVEEFGLEYILLSGWFECVVGLIPNKTINTFPGPYRYPYLFLNNENDIYEKVLYDYKSGQINQTCLSIHFIGEKVYQGPSIVQIPISLVGCDGINDIKNRMQSVEAENQRKVFQLITSGNISWSGKLDEKIQIKNGALEQFSFPEGSVFDAEINLKNGIPYKSNS